MVSGNILDSESSLKTTRPPLALVVALAALAACAAPDAPRPTNPSGPTVDAVLLVFAHPDDETMAAGLLARLRDRGVRLDALYITDGEAATIVSGRDPSGRLREARRPAAEVRQRRIDELCAAARLLGMSTLRRLGEPDKPYRDPRTGQPTRDVNRFLASGAWRRDRVLGALQQLTARYRPSLIVTTLPHNRAIHAHHQAAATIVVDALRRGLLRPRPRGALGVQERDWYPPATFASTDRPIVDLPRDACCTAGGERFGDFALRVARAHASQPPAYPRPGAARALERYELLVDPSRARHALRGLLARPARRSPPPASDALAGCRGE